MEVSDDYFEMENVEIDSLESVLGFLPSESAMLIHKDQAHYLIKKYSANWLHRYEHSFGFCLNTRELAFEINWQGSEFTIRTISFDYSESESVSNF